MSELRQMLAVSVIGLRGLGSRFATAMVIVVGMASVVGVLTSMLSLTSGLTRAFNIPDDAHRAIVWAGSANYDQSRSLHRDIVGTILDAPGIAKGTGGLLLADAEFLMPLPALEGFADGSLALRGIGPAGVAMRPALRVIAGQMFRAGRRELMVGKGASRNFGLTVGSKVHLVDGEWPIVGVFADNGDILESYLIGDSDTIMDATRRHGYSQVLA
ncbi:MAG TPA: ABC transporter permease, partial [Steroidobacteraceae bacterium]|nr:ABC transporter permease [Steroidobacteraceae bacterium]